MICRFVENLYKLFRKKLRQYAINTKLIFLVVGMFQHRFDMLKVFAVYDVIKNFISVYNLIIIYYFKFCALHGRSSSKFCHKIQLVSFLSSVVCLRVSLSWSMRFNLPAQKFSR